MAYGPLATDFYRLAASYVDRLLRGTKANELPLQFATKLRLVVNPKAAERIGLTIPEPFLLRADEVIDPTVLDPSTRTAAAAAHWAFRAFVTAWFSYWLAGLNL